MDWKIIPNEQTPAIPPMGDVQEYLKHNSETLQYFLAFASSQPTAVGLAGNQVSLNGERFMHRVFALKNSQTKEWRMIINPVIEEYIGIKELKDEGCLTWIGKSIIAERSHRVKVCYYDLNGNKTEGEIHKGFEAQIWQHECNHLNGVEERIESGDFMLPPSKKTGRNDQCPCGSGKKYKQCCI